MITIGIDPSINSTGVCVKTEKKTLYYIIAGKITKKALSFSHPRLHIYKYDKADYKDLEYSEKEYLKAKNISSILESLDEIIRKHKKDVLVRMEGISYGSRGSAALVDLAGLNFCIRNYLISKNIPFEIVSPMSLKKASTGNANAEKEEMIYMWKKLDPEMEDITSIKIDDLADAFFLTRLD